MKKFIKNIIDLKMGEAEVSPAFKVNKEYNKESPILIQQPVDVHAPIPPH